MSIKILKLSLLLIAMCSSVSQASVIVLKPLVYGEVGGDKIVYDSYQNVTWTQNASLLGNSLSWYQAVSSADTLTYAGSSNWYLPTLTNLQTLWQELSIINGYVNQTGSPSFDSGAHTPNDHFVNVQITYWSSTSGVFPFQTLAWYYTFGLGGNATQRGDDTGKEQHLGAWAIHQGNLIPQSTVPLPAAVWLFGSALFGFLFLKKRQAASKLA